jgi:hypothetical protein
MAGDVLKSGVEVYGDANWDLLKFLTVAARPMAILNLRLTTAASRALVESIWLGAHPRNKSGGLLKASTVAYWFTNSASLNNA